MSPPLWAPERSEASVPGGWERGGAPPGTPAAGAAFGSEVPADLPGSAPPGPDSAPTVYPGAGDGVDKAAHDAARHDGGPNLMLAFVCLWAGGTSLVEAGTLVMGQVARAGRFRWEMLQGLGFAGYALLGLGLVGFTFEALQWGRRRRGIAPILMVLLPALLTLAGAVCLVLFKDPGRRI